MTDFQSMLYTITVHFIFILIVTFVCFLLGKFIHNKFLSTNFFKSFRLFDLREYFPEEEIPTLKQVFYLFMIIVIVINSLYLIFQWNSNSSRLAILDIIISFYICIQMEKKSFKNKIVLFLSLPFSSLFLLLFGVNEYLVWSFIHGIILLSFTKVFFDKFLEFSETNSLGITIMLLFLIVFISFFVTMPVEDVSPLDAIAMVSNAFTSNGYSVLGHSSLGKVDALLLVWSGFLLSGVGTATLTAAIVMKHVDDKFDRLEKKVRKNRKN